MTRTQTKRVKEFAEKIQPIYQLLNWRWSAGKRDYTPNACIKYHKEFGRIK